MKINLTEINILTSWEGEILLQLNKNCTDEKIIVLESEHWTQGAILKPSDFHVEELTKLECNNISLDIKPIEEVI